MGTGEAVKRLREFVAARDWKQFHSKENLAKSISIEAGELLECFQWGSTPELSDLNDELADILIYCLLLADELNLDPETIVLQKLQKNETRYPIEKSRGNSTKHD